MGSLDVTLIYGYDLGGEEDGWKFNLQEGSDYVTAWPDWVVLDEDGNPDDDLDGFIEQASDHLVKAMAGFTEEYDCSREWSERRHAAVVAAGVDKLDFSCRGILDYDLWTFGVPLGAAWSQLIVNPDWLQPAHLHQYDALINRALKTLGLEFRDQKQPLVYATCSYG